MDKAGGDKIVSFILNKQKDLTEVEQNDFAYFILEMINRLEIHAEKGGWEGTGIVYLLESLEKNYNHVKGIFNQPVHQLLDNMITPAGFKERIVSDLTDMSNFCMMIANNINRSM